MSNLAFPLDWDGIFRYIGFPAFFKPYSGGGWKNVYRVTNPDEFFAAYRRVGPARDDAPGGDRLQRVLPLLRPRLQARPHHAVRPAAAPQRYVRAGPPIDPALEERLRDDCLKLTGALGYDFDTVELAVRDGIPYAIDF